eukprot:Hpha_TRINITY_DN12001_c0_g1::TRINITY_DN12001_c0_g1_i1::g.140897::m.140897
MSDPDVASVASEMMSEAQSNWVKEADVEKVKPSTILKTIVASLCVAAVISLAGGIYMYFQSLSTLRTSIQDTSYADMLRVAHQLNNSFKECEDTVKRLKTFFLDSKALNHEDTAATPEEQAKTWDNMIRWYEFSSVQASRQVQEIGIMLIPKTMDDPNLFYTHIWYDLLENGDREYVHARYGLHLANRPQNTTGLEADWEDSVSGYYKAPPAGENNPFGFSDGDITDSSQSGTPPKWHFARTDALDSESGARTNYVYNFSVTKFHTLVPNTTEPIDAWASDFVPDGWARGPEGAVASRWRPPTVWQSSDNYPYVFMAYDVLRAPPPPPHPWSHYRGVFTQAYFVFNTWLEVILEYRDTIADLDRSHEGRPEMVVYDLRTRRVYAATTGERQVKESLKDVDKSAPGADANALEHVVRVSDLSPKMQKSVESVQFCERNSDCFTEHPCEDDDKCYVRRMDVFRFQPPVGDSSIDASIAWVRVSSDVNGAVRTALILVIVMACGVAVLTIFIAFYEMCTSSIFLRETLRSWVTKLDDQAVEARENQDQLSFWKRCTCVDQFDAEATSDKPVKEMMESIESGLKAMLPHEETKWYEMRDPVGGNIFLWSVLQGCLAGPGSRALNVAYALMELDPTIIDTYYDRPVYKDSQLPFLKHNSSWCLGRYDGETALHLAVVLGDLDMAQKLMDRGADPLARTYGTFFLPGRQWTDDDKARTYFGEYPLSFAVGMNNRQMAQLILDHGTVKKGPEDEFAPAPGSRESKRKLLRAQDTYGNTALHIAILHRHMDMWDYIRSELEQSVETGAMWACELQAYDHTRGARGLTPLGLATVLGLSQQFAMALRSILKREWQFGRVNCKSLTMHQVDTIPLDVVEDPQEEHHVQYRSLLREVFLYQMLELATDDVVTNLMNNKWGRMVFLFHISLWSHLAFLFLLMVLVIEYTYVNTVPGERNRTLVTCEVVGGAWCLVLLFTSIVDMVAGLKAKNRNKSIRKLSRTDKGTMVEVDGKKIQFGGRQGAPWAPKNFNNPKGLDWETYYRQKILERYDGEFTPQDDSIVKQITKTIPMSEWAFFSWLGQCLFLCHFISYSIDGFDNSGSDISATLLSFSVLSFTISTLQYTLFVESLDTLVNIIMICIFKDVRNFLIIYNFFMIGFGMAMYVVYDHADVQLGLAKSSHTSWEDVSWGVDLLVRRTMGDIGSDRNAWLGEKDKYPYVAYWLMFGWTWLGLVIMLNLLISMFSATYEKMSKVATAQWRISKGRRTLLLENRMMLLFGFIKSVPKNYPDSKPVSVAGEWFRLNHASNQTLEHRYVFEYETALEDNGVEKTLEDDKDAPDWQKRASCILPGVNNAEARQRQRMSIVQRTTSGSALTRGYSWKSQDSLSKRPKSSSRTRTPPAGDLPPGSAFTVDIRAGTNPDPLTTPKES